MGAPEHPVWSPIRSERVGLSDLAPGDLVNTADGTATVAAHRIEIGDFRVANLGVDQARVYQISGLGIVVHNDSCGVTGYRAVSDDELADINATGRLRPEPNGGSMESKWFTETQEGAEAFQQKMGDSGTLIKVDVPQDVYDRSFKVKDIDVVGPGFATDAADLGTVTRV